MGRHPSRWLIEKVSRAARLRAAGNDWAAVARVLGCRPGTCQRWPTQYPEWWADETRRAREEWYRAMWVLFERTVREQLRSTDRTERMRAAAQIERTAATYPNVLSPAALAEAERVRARDAAERVGVVRVTANRPAPASPATTHPPRPPASGPTLGLVRVPAAGATIAAPAVPRPAAGAAVASAHPHPWPTAGRAVAGVLIGVGVASLGVVMGAGVIHPVGGVGVVALVAWMVWSIRAEAQRT